MEYVNYLKNQNKAKTSREVQRKREKGLEYYTPERLQKMYYAHKLAKS